MRTTFLIFSLAALLPVFNALTITSPSAGASIDPGQPITVTWSSSANDPPVFDLILDQGGSLSLTHNIVVASGISTSSGSYHIPANSAMTYGSGFVFKAQSGGVDLATSPPFDFSISLTQVTSGGVTQIVQATTFVNTAVINATPAAQNSSPAIEQTVTSSPARVSTSISSSPGSANSPYNTASTSTIRSSSDGSSVVGGMSSSSRFTTSATSTSRSTSSSASNTAASSTPVVTSANGQPRGISNARTVVNAAGVLCGIVMLVG